jgi:hypothetical protein
MRLSNMPWWIVPATKSPDIEFHNAGTGESSRDLSGGNALGEALGDSRLA